MKEDKVYPERVITFDLITDGSPKRFNTLTSSLPEGEKLSRTIKNTDDIKI